MRSRISSISSSFESIEDNESSVKRMIPHDSAWKKYIRYMKEMVGDRNHRRKCRMLECNAQNAVQSSFCKIFPFFKVQETASKDSMKHSEFIHV
ncbi:hypothetical protein NPIL_637901 [Nephila pilipes]|uniref:Uncharacterized protein n=1 Tax=Nephila pilipes TaxID=299642 RepID=A0A8X6QI68_NEPPI|nr:hypothetical protein NPIL_637901 [Nephila pilipes]